MHTVKAHSVLSFNRTIVELKLEIAANGDCLWRAFNRTIVELKHLDVNRGRLGGWLLIEPLWN